MSTGTVVSARGYGDRDPVVLRRLQRRDNDQQLRARSDRGRVSLADMISCIIIVFKARVATSDTAAGCPAAHLRPGSTTGTTAARTRGPPQTDRTGLFSTGTARSAAEHGTRYKTTSFPHLYR